MKFSYLKLLKTAFKKRILFIVLSFVGFISIVLFQNCSRTRFATLPKTTSSSSASSTSTTTTRTPATNQLQNCIGHFSDCSKSCGGGTQTFIITQEASNGGLKCPFSHGQTLSCNQIACNNPTPVACQGSWSTCSKTCGGGQRIFSISQQAMNGGAACEAVHGAVEPCGAIACAVNCQGSWSNDCSSSCNGTITYTITQSSSGGGLSCPYSNGATQACNVNSASCPVKPPTTAASCTVPVQWFNRGTVESGFSRQLFQSELVASNRSCAPLQYNCTNGKSYINNQEVSAMSVAQQYFSSCSSAPAPSCSTQVSYQNQKVIAVWNGSNVRGGQYNLNIGGQSYSGPTIEIKNQAYELAADQPISFSATVTDGFSGGGSQTCSFSTSACKVKFDTQADGVYISWSATGSAISRVEATYSLNNGAQQRQDLTPSQYVGNIKLGSPSAAYGKLTVYDRNGSLACENSYTAPAIPVKCGGNTVAYFANLPGLQGQVIPKSSANNDDCVCQYNGSQFKYDSGDNKCNMVCAETGMSGPYQNAQGQYYCSKCAAGTYSTYLATRSNIPGKEINGVCYYPGSYKDNYTQCSSFYQHFLYENLSEMTNPNTFLQQISSQYNGGCYWAQLSADVRYLECRNDIDTACSIPGSNYAAPSPATGGLITGGVK